MRNVLRIFVEEVKLAKVNALTVLLLVGVILIPTIFAGFNVLACWDAFKNTGNLTVAVANVDEGYQSDLMPTKVNVGESVLTALRANKKLNWVIVDEDEALEGAKSGKYYAALVIPKEFSKNMLSFYQDNAQSAELVLYTNEKLNAIAPKVAGKGATSISTTVNTAFAESISSVALELADSVSSYLDSDEARAAVSKIANSAGRLADRANQAADVLEMYSELAASAQRITGSASALATDTNAALRDTSGVIADAASSAGTTSESLQEALDSLSSAMDKVIDAVAEIADGELSGSSNSSLSDLSAKAAQRKAQADDAIAGYESALAALQSHGASADEIQQFQTAIAELRDLRDGLAAIETAAASGTYTGSEDLSTKARIVADTLKALKTKYIADMKSQLGDMAVSVSLLSAAASGLSSDAQVITEGLTGSLAEAGTRMGTVQTKIASLVSDTRAFASTLRTLQTDLNAALASNDISVIRQLLKPGVETLSQALAHPVKVERTAVYASENFGSSMFPLYAALSLFVGSVMIMLLVSPRVSPQLAKRFPEESRPTLRQQYWGHFCFVALVSLLQSTLLSLVGLFLIGVQVSHPLLMVMCLWVSGIVFVSVMFALINMLGAVGKALGVLLLVVQVTGSGGSYPLVLLPAFVQGLSKFLPAFHIVNCLRAAMFGIYQNDYWVALACVAAFGVVVLAVLFAGIKLFHAFTTWFHKLSEETHLMA